MPGLAEGFGRSISNEPKLELLDRLLEQTAHLRAQLPALPAGFLAARSPDQVPALIALIERSGLDAGIAIMGGVDMEDTPSKRSIDRDEQVRRRCLPHFGFVAGPGIEIPPGEYLWRQVSTSSKNARVVEAGDVVVARHQVEAGTLPPNAPG